MIVIVSEAEPDSCIPKKMIAEGDKILSRLTDLILLLDQVIDGDIAFPGPSKAVFDAWNLKHLKWSKIVSKCVEAKKNARNEGDDSSLSGDEEDDGDGEEEEGSEPEPLGGLVGLAQPLGPGPGAPPPRPRAPTCEALGVVDPEFQTSPRDVEV